MNLLHFHCLVHTFVRIAMKCPSDIQLSKIDFTKRSQSHFRTFSSVSKKTMRPIGREMLETSSQNPEANSSKIQVEKAETIWNATASAYLPLPCGHGSGKNSAPASTFSLRKEVIQPQVLLRLPCYDFTPIMNHTLGRCLPCGLARRLLVQSTFVM